MAATVTAGAATIPVCNNPEVDPSVYSCSADYRTVTGVMSFHELRFGSLGFLLQSIRADMASKPGNDILEIFTYNTVTRETRNDISFTLNVDAGTPEYIAYRMDLVANPLLSTLPPSPTPEPATWFTAALALILFALSLDKSHQR